ncbi:hypothetical protein RB595_001594 [Gaeumannomyces hyphopodioides]
MAADGRPQRPPPPRRRRILFLDAYDSFSNNITSMLETQLDVDVHVLPIDHAAASASPAAFARELAHYDAVVCGPGPGSPAVAADVGLMRRVWALPDADLLPALGVCLGFQSLVAAEAAAAGRSKGAVRRLRRALHGMVRPIEHRGLVRDNDGGGGGGGGGGGDIFAGVGEFRATLYHSLCADVGQDAVPEAEWRRGRGKWEAAAGGAGNGELVPLAWVEEPRDDDGEGGGGGGGRAPERVLAAVRHRTRPFWGLQYHPESVCTELEGAKVVANWFREAVAWNEARGRVVDRGGDILAGRSRRASLLSQIPSATKEEEQQQQQQPQQKQLSWRSHALDFQHSTDSIPLPAGVGVVDVAEILGQASGGEQVVLDSANASSGGAPDIRGRYSIVALDVPEALRLEYHVGDRHLTAVLPPAASGSSSGGLPAASSAARSREEVPLGGHPSVWHFLAGFHEARRLPRDRGEGDGRPAAPPPGDLPFMGGFMGFVTYEQGLSDINVAFPADRGHRRPDVCLSWVTRSVVVDHAKRVLHIQHLHDPAVKGQAWIDSIIRALRASPRWRHPSGGDATDEGQQQQQQPRTRRGSKPDPASRVLFSVSSISKPGADEYEAKVETCQEYIAAGESYELCLTDQTIVQRRRGSATTTASSRSWPDTAATSASDSAAAARAQKRRRSSLTCPPPPSSPASWQLFRALRSRQPAPFASYLRLGGATLVSSSPERFLQHDERGLCSMRPMKGTVRRSAAVPSLADAERILHVPKEEAENLMIVDLVRHDLHGICGAGSVAARDLMRVEEYRSVFQMTTVVEGQLPTGDGAGTGGGRDEGRYTGLDVLAASLPPGSMTGAPKKRSCEILHEIEGHVERSLYSGVVGYMCVSGRGDWSVTIRSMFRWDDEPGTEDGDEVWRIGAGGAVTILSTPQGEREEMFVKLAGPLGIFACQE